MLDRGIALVGMAGVGKSSVGKRLAEILGCDFYDTDECVERAAGMSIPEVFTEYGEARFRELETDALGACADKLAVISCGGGVVKTEANFALLGRCFTVYLTASVDTLCARVQGGEGRPLLSGDLRERIETLLTERQAAYERAADAVVHTDGLSVEQTVAAVAAAANLIR